LESLICGQAGPVRAASSEAPGRVLDARLARNGQPTGRAAAPGSVLLDPAPLRFLVVDRDEPYFSKSETVGGSFMY